MSVANTENLEVALKGLWGASRLPGFAQSTVTVEPAHWQESWRRLHQLVSVQASGLIHGPHGVGKSFLMHRFSQELSPKQYRLIRLVHTTLMGSDLLRQLVRLGGGVPNYRRSENVLTLRQLWQSSAPLWPVLIVEEAQNLIAPALEELRLLACDRPDTGPAFSLLLVGDEDLVPRLQLGINRPLLSRLSFNLTLGPWPLEALRDYLQERLKEVGMHTSPLEPPAQELLLQSAAGIPRHLNSLLQRALECAAAAKRRLVTPADVQQGLDAMPWLFGAPQLR